MKHIILFLLFFTLPFHSNAQQTNSCNNLVYISQVNKSHVLKPEDEQQYKRLDSLNNGCYNHLVIKDSANYFLIIPFYGTNKQLPAEWIIKSEFIQSNVAKVTGKFTVFIQTDTSSEVVASLNIKDEKLFDQGLVVLECQNGWYRIKLQHKNNTITGWVLERDLCSNPCTTCG